VAIGRKKSPVDAGKAGSVEAALRRSLRAAVAHEWETAETWLERIVEADSADLDAYHALARLYRQQGAVGRAIRMHQNLLLRVNVGRLEKREARLELARDFDAGGFSERAAAGYEEVLDETPKHAEALHRLVSLSLANRTYVRGLALVRRLRRVDRKAADSLDLSLHLAQADAQIDVGDADAARSTLKRCLRRYKDCGEAWSRLGALEAEKGRDARAIDAWRKAVLADATLTALLLPKIEAGFAARKKTQDYEKLLRSLANERPTDADVRIALSRWYVSRGEIKDAIEELSRAIEVAPNSVALRVALGRQLLDGGQESEALKAYGNLLDALERDELSLASAAVEDNRLSTASGLRASFKSSTSSSKNAGVEGDA
jgi:lipopolysaccharide biosynthesis regulator YciM